LPEKIKGMINTHALERLYAWESQVTQGTRPHTCMRKAICMGKSRHNGHMHAYIGIYTYISMQRICMFKFMIH